MVFWLTTLTKPVSSRAIPSIVSVPATAWIEAEASLPVGWRVSGLVREPDESWRAWALPGPHAAIRLLHRSRVAVWQQSTP